MKEDYFSFTQRIFSRDTVFEKPEALNGIRVLDIGGFVYGPHIGKVLAQFGAEVIKIEPPFDGDAYRMGFIHGRAWKYSSPLFQCVNTGKYFVTIDFRKPEGKELFMKLAQISDIVIENFRAGIVDAWGIGYSEVSKINPRIIYISCSGYGQFGPLKFFPSQDLIAQTASGIAFKTGFPGKAYKLPDAYGDHLPAMCGAVAVLAALLYRKRTGRGQYIDLSQAECLIRIMHDFTYISVTGKELSNTGNVDPTMSPSGIFKTCDGKFVALAIATDEQFTALLKAMGRTDLATEFESTFDRLKPDSLMKLNEIVEGWVKTKTEREIIKLGMEYRFPVARLLDDVGILDDEWRRERGSVVEVDDEMYGKAVFPGPVAMLHKTPGRIKWLARPVGYHNRYVFKNLLGLSEEEIKKLEKKRVIGYWDNVPGCAPPSYYNIEKDPIFKHGSVGGKDEQES